MLSKVHSNCNFDTTDTSTFLKTFSVLNTENQKLVASLKKSYGQIYIPQTKYMYTRKEIYSFCVGGIEKSIPHKS